MISRWRRRAINCASGNGEFPQEVVVIGGDGSDGTYGLWIPEHETAKALVIDIGESFEPPAFAIEGDSLGAFLAARTAFYLLMYREDGYAVEDALNVLEVPELLRRFDHADDELYYDLLNWASPNLPEKRPDPYDRPWEAERIAEFARQ